MNKKRILAVILAIAMAAPALSIAARAETLTPLELPKAPEIMAESIEREDPEEVTRSIVYSDVHPLSANEIGSLMGIIWDLNDGLTDSEYRIVRSALLTVGRIPYELTTEHPDRPGDEEEIKDKDIKEAADDAGTLDCSHWVDWIYSIAMQDSLGSGNTGYLVETEGSGSLKKVAEDDSYEELKERLRPGDIMVYTQDGSHSYGHTALFLGYFEDGSMLYVHESSARDNVSLQIKDGFGNGGTSSIYYFRHKKGW